MANRQSERQRDNAFSLSPLLPISLSPLLPHSLPPSLRAWWFLVVLSIRRQAGVRQMVWIALGLLGLTSTLVGLNTMAGRWGMDHWRWRWVVTKRLGETTSVSSRPDEPVGPGSYQGINVFLTYRQTADC